ncbi:MAG TPA: heavy-metal-associated domain-containing protein [Actinomycetota bacterium]|nr:heavy-metal-associated domain-containing protein [Actinomycetota bacterium]
MQQTFQVPEVSCEHCKSSIEGALQPVEGVASATVDVESKLVTVDFDDSVVGKDKLVEAINAAGYEVAS